MKEKPQSLESQLKMARPKRAEVKRVPLTSEEKAFLGEIMDKAVAAEKAGKLKEALDLYTDYKNELLKIKKEKEEPEIKMDKSYRQSAEVNGMEFTVYWDTGYDDFCIYFTQIDLAEARKRNINDQVIRLTVIPEEAKKVFDFTVKEAENVSDVYDLFKKVEKFSLEKIVYEEEDLEKAA